MGKSSRVILLAVVATMFIVAPARADVIYLTTDRYQASASVSIVNPMTGAPETWSTGPVIGSVFGPGGGGQLHVAGGSSQEGAETQVGVVAAGSGLRAHANGDGHADAFSFDTHFDSYLAFVVAGTNTSLSMFAERSGTHAATGYRLVDFTTGTTLLDQMLAGPVLPAGSFFAHDTIALNDQHSYGLWTSAAVLDMTDPVAAIEFTTNADIVPTPEPASLLLLGSTAAGLIYRKRRAAKAAAKAQTPAV